MTAKARLALALTMAWGFVVGAVGIAALLVATDLSERERALIAALVRKELDSLIVAALLVLLALGFIVRTLVRRYVTAPAQLGDDVQIMVAANPAHRAPPRGSAEIRRLAESVNGLAEARESLQHDVDARVREANERIEQERNRLAALMSELAHSVVVCNIEGRILLYNARAMLLLHKPLDGTPAGKAHSLLGLGRSIFAIFDRNLIIHALDGIVDRLRQRTRAPVANFVATAPAGQLVRVQMAPVLASAPEASLEGPANGITGFVLVVEDITRRIESGNRRDLLLQTLHARHARLARQHPRRGRGDRVLSRDGQGRAGPIYRHHRRRGAAVERPARSDRGGVRRLAANRVAARGHAGRGPDRGGAAADRKQVATCDEARERRRIDLAQGRQLLADAGHYLPRQPAS